jgi:hypothetical protein
MTKELKTGSAEEEGRRLFSAGQKKQNRPIAGKEGGTEILMRLSEQSSEVVSVFIEEGKIFIFSSSKKHL